VQGIAQRFGLPAYAPALKTWPRWSNLDARKPTREIRLSTITDLGSLEALGEEWRALFVVHGRPHQVFQTFDWLVTWARIYAARQRTLTVVTGRLDGKLVLVWPLVVERRFGLRIATWMGDPLSQYGDALMVDDLDPASAEAVFEYIIALPVDVLALRRVRDDAAIAPLLRRRLGPPVNVQASPFVDLSDRADADAFDMRFAGKLRSSRRRRRRRLEERGPVAFIHHGPSAEAAGLVASALAYKREWARQAGILAPALLDPRFERFFVAACEAVPELRVSALRCGEETLGVEISVACKGLLFGHVLAPRPGFGAWGLGGILAEQIIHNAIREGYDGVDLLAPADDYKLEWTAVSVGVGDFCLPLSLRGSLYMWLWLRFGRAALKKLLRRTEPVLAKAGRLFKIGPTRRA
jgi:CelD/BcsL family acetyltransferase involved in cellulose biosynthesis